MKNFENKVIYSRLPDTQTIHIITNLSEKIKENISYSTDPALQSLQDYIQFVAKEDLPIIPESQEQKNKCPIQRAKEYLWNILWWDKISKTALCPFLPGMNKKNLHYALLYNEAIPDLNNFYKTCFHELKTVQKHNKSKLATLYGIFSEPRLDTQKFSDELQMYCMKRKSEVVASWHMAGAMLSRHRPGWAERIFNQDTFSTKANNFKTEWFSYIAFRKLHFDDYGSMRTPENMESFMPHFPGMWYQTKYIPQFIQFLQDKIQQDKEDILMLEHMDPDSIIIHYYEHHLMHCDSKAVIDLRKLLEQNPNQGKKELEQIIANTQKKYELYIGKLKKIEQEVLNAYSTMHWYTGR